jgi:hypothetical protein
MHLGIARGPPRYHARQIEWHAPGLGLEEPRASSAAQLCRLAGADEALIPAWIAEE